MALVECRQSALAALAVAILREERVAIGGSDSAGSINGLRPGVGHQRGNSIGVALRQLRSHRVVVTVAAVLDQDEQAEVRIGRAAGYRSRPGNRRTDSAVGFEMVADGAYITGFDGQVLGKLVLHVE